MIQTTVSISPAYCVEILSEEELNLRELRDKAGLTQNQVCWELRLNNSTYRSWESGTKTMTLPVWEYQPFLEKMAALFKCSEETLIRAFELSYLQGQAKIKAKKKGK